MNGNEESPVGFGRRSLMNLRTVATERLGGRSEWKVIRREEGD